MRSLSQPTIALARVLYLRAYASRSMVVMFMLLIALVLKFLSPLFRFSVPLGYDPGIYRYLFLQYSAVHSIFDISHFPPWVQEHSLGLFLFTTPLIKLGMPVDWLIGWIWSLLPVLLACVLAYASAKEWNARTGIAVLIVLLISEGFYTGFASMFWKTYAALVCCTLSFFFFPRNLPLATFFGILTVVTHNQTGLLFGCSLMTWVLLQAIYAVHNPEQSDSVVLRRIIIAGITILILGAVSYIPIWGYAVVRPFALFLEGWNAPGGTFPFSSSYLARNGILLLLGVLGFCMTLRNRKWTLWHIVVLWSAFFVFSRLFFYRRFMIQLDFFLTPFAAFAIATFWKRFRYPGHRMGFVLLIIFQAFLSIQAVLANVPRIENDMFLAIKKMQQDIPQNAMIITMDDKSGIMLRGWLPNHKIGAQGVFDLDWNYNQWEQFLFGTHTDRQQLLWKLQTTNHGPLYIFASPYFFSYYKEHGKAFIEDACFQKTDNTYLSKVVCNTADGREDNI